MKTILLLPFIYTFTTNLCKRCVKKKYFTSEHLGRVKEIKVSIAKVSIFIPPVIGGLVPDAYL